MKKFTLIGLMFSLLVLFSCERDDLKGDKIQEGKDAVIILRENLGDRVSKENAGVVSLIGPNTVISYGGLKSAAIGSEETDDPASDLPLVLVAEVAAPKYQGTTLRATHVVLNGNYAYVSYNLEGDNYLGAIDLIDISDPDNPHLVESAILPKTDVSSIAYADNTLYLATASLEFVAERDDRALLIQMKLDGGFFTDDLEFMEMAGYVATDIAVGNNMLYGVSGDNGLLGAYSLTDHKLKSSTNLADLRAVGLVDGQVVALSGATGIRVYDASLNETKQIATSSADVPHAKRTLDFYSGNVLAAEGFNGVGVYDLTSGTKGNTIPIARPNGLEASEDEIVSNAVSVNNNHIFMANGAAGVAVISMVSGDIEQVVDFGSIALPGSANYVRSEGIYVFVADGFGGLQILKMLAGNAEDDDDEPELTCDSYPFYEGNKNLTVTTDLSYRGPAALNHVEVNSNASLTWCGTLGVGQHIVINSYAVLHIIGELAQGEKNQNFYINQNGTLRIEGDITIYGNLVLHSYSTIEFIGPNSSITIHGTVTKADNVSIIGDFTDHSNKLK
ncbi:hypothetical protein [Gaoshiqia sp. Z1-71]|uniref:hypothetical protein n=1 Tax=Gaoshiqia hydrogeniformans TaxID=3290090 RepID=UPI003BF8D618